MIVLRMIRLKVKFVVQGGARNGCFPQSIVVVVVESHGSTMYHI
jgi:hypothetical protein